MLTIDKDNGGAQSGSVEASDIYKVSFSPDPAGGWIGYASLFVNVTADGVTSQISTTVKYPIVPTAIETYLTDTIGPALVSSAPARLSKII